MNVRDVLMKVFESETNISSLYFTHCHVFYLCKTKEGIFKKTHYLKVWGLWKTHKSCIYLIKYIQEELHLF